MPMLVDTAGGQGRPLQGGGLIVSNSILQSQSYSDHFGGGGRVLIDCGGGSSDT